MEISIKPRANFLISKQIKKKAADKRKIALQSEGFWVKHA